jgi:hypothetical protein
LEVQPVHCKKNGSELLPSVHGSSSTVSVHRAATEPRKLRHLRPTPLCLPLKAPQVRRRHGQTGAIEEAADLLDRLAGIPTLPYDGLQSRERGGRMAALNTIGNRARYMSEAGGAWFLRDSAQSVICHPHGFQLTWTRINTGFQGWRRCEYHSGVFFAGPGSYYVAFTDQFMCEPCAENLQCHWRSLLEACP